MFYSGSSHKFFTVWALMLAVILFASGPVWSETFEVAEGTGTHMKVQAVVNKIQGNVVFAKAPWGELTIGTTKKLKNDIGLGDEVILYINADNTVIDVHRKDEPAPRYRLLTGNLIYTTPVKNEILLWTAGGMKEFKVDDVAIGRLNAIPEGSPVTVEVNEDGRIIHVHKLMVTMDVNAPFPVQEGEHVKVTGTVTEVQGPVVSVKTPFGHMNVSEVMGAQDVRPGEKLVLWMTENKTVVDVQKIGEEMPAHRYITGRLAYVTEAKDKIRLETPEGEKEFPVTAEQQETLSSVKEGERITVELNKDNKVIAVKKAGTQT